MTLDSRDTKIKTNPSLKELRVQQRKGLCTRHSQHQVAARVLRGKGCPLGSLRSWHVGEALDIHYLLIEIRAETLGLWGNFFFCLLKHFCICQGFQNGLNTICIVRGKNKTKQKLPQKIACQYQKY